MTADRFTRAVTWVLAADDALRAFLTGAGWAPDGAHRELDLDGTGRPWSSRSACTPRSPELSGLGPASPPRRFRPTRASLAPGRAVS